MQKEKNRSLQFKFWKTLLGVVSIVILSYVGVWASVLASSDPLNHPLAHWPVWPVACSTRGCITSADWLYQHQLGLAFARATNQDLPSPVMSLTTSVRRHLVSHAFLRSPITQADARRYREDILHIVSEDQVQALLGTTEMEYDTEVILPFLQQEALRQERKVESVEELYNSLSQERAIIVLLFRNSWGTDTGEILAQ